MTQGGAKRAPTSLPRCGAEWRGKGAGFKWVLGGGAPSGGGGGAGGGIHIIVPVLVVHALSLSPHGYRKVSRVRLPMWGASRLSGQRVARVWLWA